MQTVDSMSTQQVHISPIGPSVHLRGKDWETIKGQVTVLIPGATVVSEPRNINVSLTIPGDIHCQRPVSSNCHFLPGQFDTAENRRQRPGIRRDSPGRERRMSRSNGVYRSAEACRLRGKTAGCN